MIPRERLFVKDFFKKFLGANCRPNIREVGSRVEMQSWKICLRKNLKPRIIIWKVSGK